MGLILVASTDAAEIETIKAALSVHGWWVTVAADREAALQAAADQAPKMVVVDSELEGSLELVRTFGSANGGPGALVCVPAGFERSLEMKEAGVDELVTKPLSPPALLEVVQRCLSAPRPSEPERPASPSALLTTEEIFGDVLRELEGDGEADTTEAPVAEPPSIPSAPPVPESPASQPALAAAETLPTPEPVVSLAGLFDSEEPEGAMEPPSTVESSPDDADWNGEDRRGSDRPWTDPDDAASTVDELFAGVGVELRDGEMPSLAPEDAALLLSDDARDEESELATPLVEVPVEPPLEPAEEPVVLAAVESGPAPIESDEPNSEPAGERRSPRFALLLAAAAVIVLAIVGFIFVRNPGSILSGGQAADAAPSEASGDPAAPAGPATEALAPVAADPAPNPPTEPQASEEPAPVQSEVASADPIEDLDLEAIVEEEMTRREDELRQVFVEEEKRLLRELSQLEESEPTDDDGDAESSNDG